jgi:hypothetical protein
MKQIVHHILHPGSVELMGVLGMAASRSKANGVRSGLWGSESSHSSSGGVRHYGGDREAESGIAASTRRGGVG